MKKVLFPILALVLALGLALPMAMPAVASPDPGLVGLWHLDGNANDSSGNGNHGTLLPMGSEPTWTSGKYGQALSFDGSNDYVDVGAAVDNTVSTTNALTLEAWINYAGTPHQNGGIISNDITYLSNSGYDFFLWNNGYLFIDVGNGTTEGRVSYEVPDDFAWHHVAATWDGSTVRLYFDGAPVGTPAALTGSYSDAGKNTWIGKINWSTNCPFNGLIDEVRIWDEALSAEQIADSAEYGIVIQKEMSQDEADLGDHVTITLEVVAAETDVEVVDTLPGELRYIATEGIDVTGGTAICEGSDHEITCTLGGNVPYTISFDAQVTSAEAEDITVENTAAANGTEAEAELVIHPYEGFTKEMLGDSEVPLGTDVHWLVGIVLVNVPGDEIETMEDVVVKDRLGGDLELHCTVESMGATTWYTTGKTAKVHLTWDLGGDLGNEEWAWLVLDISTDLNPGTGNGRKPGQQEYTSLGDHDLNSGAVVKFIDSETGFQLSAHTGPLTVTATETAEVTRGVLWLCEKNPDDWSIVPDRAEGLLGYNLEGADFDYVFVGTGLGANTNYSLIYYADPWPGDGGTHATGALIATMTTDDAGNALAFGAVELDTDLPNPDDDNASSDSPPCACDPCPGAKVWLVLASHYSTTTPGMQGNMIGWSPAEYLFEYNSILYDDTDAP